MSGKRICVIGAGASGLTAIKQCVDENFQVICYEKTNNCGGLWRYREENCENVGSVFKSTITNSSKELSAFSDFPPPLEYPHIMHNTQVCAYFEKYAETFNLEERIKYNHEVLNVTFNDDYEITGKWKVTVKNLRDNEQNEQIFDGVMVCVGHHCKPNIPNFEGMNQFKGQLMHTHCYKKPNAFEDKVVVVVGIGNSGADAAVELSSVCSQVYLSTRSGSWILPLVGSNGVPLDLIFMNKAMTNFLKFIPQNLLAWGLEKVANSYFDHELYGLKPKHRILNQHMTVNDRIQSTILSGRVLVRKNIERFTENGVIFEGNTKETKCDVVLFATGYEIIFPFLDSSIIEVYKNKVELFKYVFSPKLKHAHTLAVIGLLQPSGAVFPASELQSRWFVQLMTGKAKLPTKEEMQQSIVEEADKIKKQFYESARNTIEVEVMGYNDEIASYIGAKPNLWKLALSDPKLWRALFFGPFLPYKFRLQGPHT
ncbi:dimethylaniline monooxygenase [N-oxide-forming] 5-like protein, partial [Leptotrombidium deliense]